MPLKPFFCLMCLLSMSAHASTDAGFAGELQPAFLLAADGRYELAERRAERTLDVLKALREYAREVERGGQALRSELLADSYEDLVNTQLLPVLADASALHETIDRSHALEKGNIKSDLRAAKAGDHIPLDRTLARVAAFEAAQEQRIKAVEARLAGVRVEYARHFGLAHQALALFKGMPLVVELLAAKPKLVKKIELAPASLRPLIWRIELVKERGDYNDPRYARLPVSIAVTDGARTAAYAVVVRR